MKKKPLLNEEITASEVKSIVSSKLDDFLKERDFERRVNELTAKALEKFITDLYTRRLMWTQGLKK